MKSYRKELWFETPSRRAFINITRQVEAALKESGIRDGLCWSTPCTSPPRCSSTTTRAGCTPTMKRGSRAWRRTRRFRATATTRPARTTPTPI